MIRKKKHCKMNFQEFFNQSDYLDDFFKISKPARLIVISLKVRENLEFEICFSFLVKLKNSNMAS